MHPWLNWIEHRPPKAGIARSNRAGCTNKYKMAQELWQFVFIVVTPRFERAAFDTIVGKNKRETRSSRLTRGEQRELSAGCTNKYKMAQELWQFE